MRSKQVSAIAVGVVGFGLIFIWAGLRGSSVIATIQDLVMGKKPEGDNTNPIVGTTTAPATTDGSVPAATTTTTAGWGDAEASSFWDPGAPTASGRPMGKDTVASPYLPLGTQVDVNYKGKTVHGTVWDAGPADWVMAANPDRFLDIAEPMMVALTGAKGNVIKVKYRVTAYGTGRIYRPNHPMTKKLRAQWKR
jgi:hypothetical protein